MLEAILDRHTPLLIVVRIHDSGMIHDIHVVDLSLTHLGRHNTSQRYRTGNEFTNPYMQTQISGSRLSQSVFLKAAVGSVLSSIASW